jgi:hypothetical protein
MKMATRRIELVRPGLGATLLTAMVVGCGHTPSIVTTLVFDGQKRTITTNRVICTNQTDGKLLIVVDGGRTQSIRVLLDRRARLIVERAGLRHQDLAGFVADPGEVVATKVDDTYRFTGRMPPKAGELQWHEFEIETTCPVYRDQPPPPSPGPFT